MGKGVVRIDNIPMESLETLKKWLDSCSINFYESPENYNWRNIMKRIRQDPQGFFAQGGWADMLAAPEEEEDEIIDPEDDDFGEEDFAVAEDDDDSLEIYSGESEGSDDDEDDDDDDVSDEAPGWDELEKNAEMRISRKRKSDKNA